MKSRHILPLAFSLALPIACQAQNSALSSAAVPASMQQILIPSHGSNLLGIFYLAAGTGPHPTAVIFHGFPGFEQNLDIAQALRAHGWNVLAMHYRGSWGVKGNFSFEHAAADADTQVRFLLDPVNARKYRVDTHRIVVIGHSMGGFMAASAAANNRQVAGAVLISAWNIGADYEVRHHIGSAAPTIENEAKGLGEHDSLAPLSGTSGVALAREIYEHQRALNFNYLAPAVSPRPVFIITANDGIAPIDKALGQALRKAGDTRVTERHWDTDHSYSAERAELIEAVLAWAETNVPD